MRFTRYITIAAFSLLTAISCRPKTDEGIENIYNVKPEKVFTEKSTDKIIEIILDTSGSMDEKLDGTKKIDSAKENLEQMLQEVNKYNMKMHNVKAGLLYFEGRTVKCAVAMSDLNYDIMSKEVNKFTANFSTGTPLGVALAYAERQVDKYPGKRNIIMLTDGENTNGREPENIYEDIIATNEEFNDGKTTLYVIAYDTNKNNFRELEKFGATIYEAKSAADLTKVLTVIRTDIMAESPIAAPGQFKRK